ncbi:MAG: hypothetical protein WA902_03135 [Thermosynechococcaceae cyanobacterium]
MIDPVTITASAITKLAFETFVKTGAGEAAKKVVAGTADLIKGLRDRIRAEFQGNERATAAISELEQQGSVAALQKVSKYLDLKMNEEPMFADEVKQITQQIINIQNQSNVTLQQQNNNYGRDQNIFNQPQGDIRVSNN